MSVRYFPFALVGFLFSLLAVNHAFSYDAPKIEQSYLDPDALLLEEDEEKQLLTLLAALACNFPKNEWVDDDLREKCLSIALKIDPLHPPSRRAHRDLLRKNKPQKTGNYEDTVTEVSEELWKWADKIRSQEVEPETFKLLKFVREISLISHPNPPEERIQIFAKVNEEQKMKWNRFLTLTPSSKSNQRLKNLFTAKPSYLPSDPNPFEIVSTPEVTKTTPEMGEETMTIVEPSSQSTPIKLNTLSVKQIVSVLGSVRSKTIGGNLTLNINESEDSEIDSKIGTIRGTDFRKVQRIAKVDFPSLAAHEAIFEFKPITQVQIPPRLAKTNFGVGAALALHSAYSGKAIDQKMIFTGHWNSDDYLAVDPEKLPAILEAARDFEGEIDYLVVPNNQYDRLVKGAISSQKIELLINPEIIGYESWQELQKLAYGEASQKLNSAKAAFEEIKAVQERMPLDELARNQVVQERLEKIIEQFPNHLSAKIMLAFGTSSVTTDTSESEMAIEVTYDDYVNSADEIIESHYSILKEIAESFSQNKILSLSRREAIKKLGTADEELAKLQVSTNPEEINDYISQCREIGESLETFLSKSQSKNQERESIRELIDDVKALRAKRKRIGINFLSEDEE